MIFDAIVLAGGRSSRLDGSPKQALTVDGETLLARAVAAAGGARRIVVVGEVDALPLDLRLDDRVLVTREDPPFGGPVAAIAAARAVLAALESGQAGDLLVLACDMPDAAGGIDAVLAAAEAGQGRQAAGFIAVDEQGHPQPLLAVYDGIRLWDAIDARDGEVDGMSMRSLIEGFDLVGVEVPAGAADDIDTWDDAARHGIERDPAAGGPSGTDKPVGGATDGEHR